MFQLIDIPGVFGFGLHYERFLHMFSHLSFKKLRIIHFLLLLLAMIFSAGLIACNSSDGGGGGTDPAPLPTSCYGQLPSGSWEFTGDKSSGTITFGNDGGVILVTSVSQASCPGMTVVPGSTSVIEENDGATIQYQTNCGGTVTDYTITGVFVNGNCNQFAGTKTSPGGYYESFVMTRN